MCRGFESRRALQPRFFALRFTVAFGSRLRGISAIGDGGVFSNARITARNSSSGTLIGSAMRLLYALPRGSQEYSYSFLRQPSLTQRVHNKFVREIISHRNGNILSCSVLPVQIRPLLRSFVLVPEFTNFIDVGVPMRHETPSLQ